uniref:Ribonuclease H-like domain-containing protein n=1 Tax=Tanacetum cinerariifolium TaxID=118510 RepID=A0A6L2KQF1_TANCI|nr:ribonuclease H-like domain-containing protein [Tanacetum cinerariifolium]
MSSQDARLTKFEADFKQQQSEMTNKIDAVLKAITDQIAGALPSDTVKNPKLGTSLVLSTRSYPTVYPQCSSHPSTSINAIKAHSKEATISQKSLLRPEIEIETKQPEELRPTLKDEFQDLHLNVPILEVLAHAPIYNVILHKYVEILELGKNRPSFVQREILAKMGDPELFTLPGRLGESKPFDTLADLGSCDPETPLLVGRGFLATTNAVIDCRMAKIVVGEGITRESYKPRPRSDGVGAQTPYYARKDFLDCHLPEEWEIARDAELNPFKDTLVFRRIVEFLEAIPINLKSNMWESDDLIKNPINWDKPPKDGDGAWHAKIRPIDPYGKEFTKTLQSIPTTRKLSEI